MVVGIEHLHFMPFAVAEILCRGRGDEPRGMTTCRHHLSIGIKKGMLGAGDMHIGQPLHFKFDARRHILLPSFLRHQWQGEQKTTEKQPTMDLSNHCCKITHFFLISTATGITNPHFLQKWNKVLQM